MDRHIWISIQPEEGEELAGMQRMFSAEVENRYNLAFRADLVTNRLRSEIAQTLTRIGVEDSQDLAARLYPSASALENRGAQITLPDGAPTGLLISVYPCTADGNNLDLDAPINVDAERI